ncbi:MAG: hypothetical protein L3J76_06060 [Candidatus Hydrothermae bacterium]|nr:hypothetical protein [Candidatus Hydrothermae bacterium]
MTLMVRPPLDSGGLNLRGIRYAYPVLHGWAEGGLLLYSKREDGVDSEVLQATVARSWLVPLDASAHRRYVFLRMGALLDLYRGGLSTFVLQPPLRPALELGLSMAAAPRLWMHVQLVPPALAWTYILPDGHFALTGGVEGYCAYVQWAGWDTPLCSAVRWRVVAGISLLSAAVFGRTTEGEEP